MRAKKLPLIEYLRQRFDYGPETGALTWRPWPGLNRRRAGKEVGVHPQKGYRVLDLDGRWFLAHRICWALHHGAEPDGEIDHINQIKSDNRISNLRVVDSNTNQRNRPVSTRNTSGVVGVYWVTASLKWHAEIGTGGGGVLFLGAFDRFGGAVAARRAAEKMLGYHKNHGAFTRATIDAVLDLV